MATSLRLALVGGGTGGHVVPGLNLVEAAVDAGEAPADLLWFTTGRSVEEAAFGRLPALLARGGAPPVERLALRIEPAGGGAPSLPRLALRTPGCTLVARRALARHAPDVLLGLGGFTQLPAVLAAVSLRIPVVLLEVNAVRGRAVGALGPLARRVVHAWPGSLPGGVETARHRLLGPPVAPSLARGDAAPWRARPELTAPTDRGQRPLLAVLGGSQGAGALNDFVRTSLAGWLAAGLRVVHQVGPQRLAEAAPAAPGYLPLEFVDDVPGLLAAATLVLGRAGASTVAEAAALGVPLVAVPYPGAGGHQRDNARQLGDGVRIVEQDALGPEVAAEVARLAGPEGAAWRAGAAVVLRERVPLDGAQRLLAALHEVVGGRRP